MNGKYVGYTDFFLKNLVSKMLVVEFQFVYSKNTKEILSYSPYTLFAFSCRFLPRNPPKEFHNVYPFERNRWPAFEAALDNKHVSSSGLVQVEI